MPDLSDLQALPAEQRALILDVGQFALDAIGVVEPTPFADVTSGVVSLFRGDMRGALFSGISVVPYVGDLAKLGKMPKYLRTVERAIQMARTDGKFAAMLRPVLARLSSALERAPMDRLPPLVVDALDRMQRLIVDFLPVGARVSSRLDQLTEDVLKRVFGSARNVGVLPRRNVRTLVEFFEKHDVSGRNPAQWAELLKGIDLHAAEPITVVRFRPGDLVAQYVETGRDAGKRIGQWMVRSQGAVSHRNIGLSGGGRVRKVFRVKQEVEMLKSRAAPAADYWTAAGAKPHLALKVEDGKRVRTAAEQVAGGGDQYFLPEAWRYLEEVPSAR